MTDRGTGLPRPASRYLPTNEKLSGWHRLCKVETMSTEQFADCRLLELGVERLLPATRRYRHLKENLAKATLVRYIRNLAG